MKKQQINIEENKKLETKDFGYKSTSEVPIRALNFRPFGTFIDNFYMTDFVCENSAIMAKASKVRFKNKFFKEKSIYN